MPDGTPRIIEAPTVSIISATDLGNVEVAKEGNHYLLTDPRGDIRPDGRGLGLYHLDTRILSSSILRYSPGTEVVSIVIWELWENGQYVELSALGVLFIIALFFMVMIAQWIGKKFGVKE